MKNVKMIAATAVLLSSILAVSSSAQMGKMPGHMKRAPGGMEMGFQHDGPMAMWNVRHVMYAASQLGLDEKQMGNVRSILKKFQIEMIRQRADIEIAHVELHDILMHDPVDMKVAAAKVRQIESLKADAVVSHIQSIEDVKSKLTPEQRKKFVSIMAWGPMACPMMPGRPGMPSEHPPAPPAGSKAPKAAPHA